MSDYLEFYFMSVHFLDRVVEKPHEINIYKVSTIVLHFVLGSKERDVSHHIFSSSHGNIEVN